MFAKRISFIFVCCSFLFVGAYANVSGAFQCDGTTVTIKKVVMKWDKKFNEIQCSFYDSPGATSDIAKLTLYFKDDAPNPASVKDLKSFHFWALCQKKVNLNVNKTRWDWESDKFDAFFPEFKVVLLNGGRVKLTFQGEDKFSSENLKWQLQMKERL